MAGKTPAQRVGISGSYGGLNLGDEAILESIIVQLRRALPVEITVFSRQAEDTRQRHEVERVVPVRDLTARRRAPRWSAWTCSSWAAAASSTTAAPRPTCAR
ncbi:MAG: hypothetical protein AB1505_20380 [Candidatus Latescibacterota bacterium]